MSKHLHRRLIMITRMKASRRGDEYKRYWDNGKYCSAISSYNIQGFKASKNNNELIVLSGDDLSIIDKIEVDYNDESKKRGQIKEFLRDYPDTFQLVKAIFKLLNEEKTKDYCISALDT